MKKRNELIAAILALAVFLGLGWTAGQLLLPPRTEYGSMWDAYLQEPAESEDILFFGSSLVYCSVIPAYIWEQSGLRSFVLAGPEQTMPMTLYSLREACRTQDPKLVALDCTAMFFPRYKNYTKANLSYMPMGTNRITATFRSAPAREWPSLLFPILYDHYRWREITPEELGKRLRPEQSETAGYTVLTSTWTENVPEIWDEFSLENADYNRNLEYLREIRDFCAEREIALLLYLTPTASKLPEASLRAVREDTAALGITFEDFNEQLPMLGIDDESDWYDCLHFNLRGAEKYSRWLAEYLAGRMEARAQSETETALWQRRADYLRSIAETEGNK